LTGAGGAGFAVYDMVEEWRALTNLPAVLAVWAARQGVVTAEIADDFRDSLALGMEQIEEIAREASGEMGLPASELLTYLKENIQYRLDEEDLRGLRKYYEYAAELGLIGEAKKILISGAGGRGETELAGAARQAK
jgi:chorismate dehydratase